MTLSIVSRISTTFILKSYFFFDIKTKEILIPLPLHHSTKPVTSHTPSSWSRTSHLPSTASTTVNHHRHTIYITIVCVAGKSRPPMSIGGNQKSAATTTPIRRSRPSVQSIYVLLKKGGLSLALTVLLFTNKNKV